MILILKNAEDDGPQAYSKAGNGGNGIPYIPITLIPEQDCWDGRMHTYIYIYIYDFFHIVIRKEKVLSVPTSNRLKAFLMSWVVFGMSGPFRCPSAYKMAADQAGHRRKAPFMLWCCSDPQKKGPLCRLQDLPPRTPWLQCSTGPWITMRRRLRSRGLLGPKGCQLHSNILPRFHVWPYMCVSGLLIFHHIVLSTWCNI